MKRWRLDVSYSLGVCLEGLKETIVTSERIEGKQTNEMHKLIFH